MTIRIGFAKKGLDFARMLKVWPSAMQDLIIIDPNHVSMLPWNGDIQFIHEFDRLFDMLWI